MFRRSAPSSQPDLFSSFESHFKGRKQAQLNDPSAWHNVFYAHITCKIDEDVFSVLFDRAQGRPNASVRRLVSMMILKEGFGWSDAQLFEHCGFNILVMRALGLMNLSDEVPVASTYYLFKQSVYAYGLQTGRNLIGETFFSLTKTQARVFGVTGDQVRMDSKLIGANIATCCRLQLVVGCLQGFWGSLDKGAKERLCAADREVLDALLKVKPHQVGYPLSSAEKGEKLEALGLLVCRLLAAYQEKDSDEYGLIVRVFSDQYTVSVSASEKSVLPKPSQSISSSSLQSVHDPDATFRRKGVQKVKGYSVNLTETCDGEGLNLITDVEVKAATAADNAFVQPAIERTQEVVGQVSDVSMDGAYHAACNSAYADKEDKQFYYSGLQGRPGRLIYERTEEGVEVIDRHSGEIQLAQEYKPGKYKLFIAGKPRYITQQDILAYHRRKQIEDMPVHIRNRRHNVEASIFQLSYHTTGGKTRYRRLLPHQVWAWCRSLWINLVRIKNYLAQPNEDPPIGAPC